MLKAFYSRLLQQLEVVTWNIQWTGSQASLINTSVQEHNLMTLLTDVSGAGSYFTEIVLSRFPSYVLWLLSLDGGSEFLLMPLVASQGTQPGWDQTQPQRQTMNTIHRAFMSFLVVC